MPTNDDKRFISNGRGVGKQFAHISNTDITDYCNALTDRGAFVDSAGSLCNGQRVFMSMFLPNGAEIIDEQAGQHLLLTTAHDGTACFEALVAVMLTVCWNTLQWNRKNATTRYKIRHTHKATERLSEADRIIDVAAANFTDSVTIFRNMAQKQLSDYAARAFIESMLEGKRQEKARQRVMDLYKGEQIGGDLKARKNTVYGLVNAFGQWIETDMTIRKHENEDGATKDDSEARMATVVFGAGALKRDKILNAAMDLL
jgi:phage/plasmid-like protein (TIGR03299 family)